MFIEFLFLECT